VLLCFLGLGIEMLLLVSCLNLFRHLKTWDLGFGIWDLIGIFLGSFRIGMNLRLVDKFPLEYFVPENT